MTSKAERKRKKRIVIVGQGGRPRLDGPREPSGRRDRFHVQTETERKARQTVTEARQRLFGVREEHASLPEAMSVLGRLKLSGEVTETQADAALRYQEIRNRYRLSICAAPDYREHPRETESEGEEMEEWAARVRQQYDAMSSALSELCVEVRNPAPKAAIEIVVMRDVEMPELIGSLRLALNALVRHFAGENVRRFASAS